VDNEIGAAGSTGRGEANLQNCSSFMIVELMRSGMSPEEACLEVLRRVAKKTEKRLRNKDGEPNYGLRFYALRKDGLVGGANMRGKGSMAYHDGSSCRKIAIPGLY
jgi:N4-(beta-N-acetylglucosaminyl)-L-asparaginase